MLFDLEELSRRVGVSKRTIMREIKDGKLKFVRVRGQLRFREEDYINYINNNLQ